MTTAHREYAVQAEALQDYLYHASSDGLGPEVIVCDDAEQAGALFDELLILMHSHQPALIHALHQEERVTVWLTDSGRQHVAGHLV